MFKYVLSLCLAFDLFTWSQNALGGDLKDAGFVFRSLEKLTREFDSCRLVVASRESTEGSQPDVVFSDIWIDGDSIQCKELKGKHFAKSPKWWDGYDWEPDPFSTNILVDQVLSPSFLRVFVDAHQPKHSSFTPTVPGRENHIGVYSTEENTGAMSTVQIPLIGLNRKWDIRMTELDFVMTESSPEYWELIGNENLGDISTVKYRVVRIKREFIFGEQEKLFVADVWYLWFTESLEYLPMRMIATNEYLLDGTWYPLVGKNGEIVIRNLCELSDPIKINDRVSYPRNGKHIMKVPKNLRGKSSFNLQSIVEELRENGRLVDRNPAYLETVVDWKVLELKPIEKGMKLWIEAPLGSVDISGNVFRITGKTDAESQKLLDSVPPAKKRAAPDFEP
jgi:hypothetical protein